VQAYCGCQRVQDRLQESRRKATGKIMQNISSKKRAATATVSHKNDRTDNGPSAHFPSVVYGACDFGLHILSFTPSMARSRSWVICCDVRSCQTGKSNIEEKQRRTEKIVLILTIGEIFAGSLVFETFASASGVSGDAALKSTSIGYRQSRVGANVIGDCQRLGCLFWV
jgi:hypothetical protein